MTDLATLGLAIDSSPAAKAASDLGKLSAAADVAEKAVDGVGAAASRAGKGITSAIAATKQMQAAVNGTVGANDNAVGAINRHLMAINRLTEAERRMSGSIGRGADIAAYGKELDSLRAKFNPLFATIQNYKGAQAEIRRAHALGAISTGEMTAALSLERQAALSSIAALKAHRTAVVANDAAARSAASHSTNKFNTANVAAQFQDIAVTAQMGMSPIQIALQQGTQLASVLAMMEKPLGGIVAGFASLFSLTSLLTIALVAASAAALQWMFSAKNNAGKMDEALQKHAKSVDELRRLYGEAAEAATNLASAGGDAFSSASVRYDVETLRNVLKMQQQVMAQGLKGDSWLSGLWGGSSGSVDQLRNLRGEQIKFKGAVDEFLESVRRGDRDLEVFRSSVEATFQELLKTSENPTELRAMADAVLAMGESATEVEGKFAPFSGAINKLILGFAEGKNEIVEFNREVSRIGASNSDLQKLADEAIVLGQNIVRVTTALEEMERARVRATEQTRDRLASERNDVGQSYYQDRERQWELEDRILDAQTKQLKALTDQERIAAAGDLARAQNPVKGDEQRRQVAIAERQERERLDQAAKESAIQRARERDETIIAANEEISLLGKTVGEVAKLRYQYEQMAQLREEAARTGREIDQAEIAAIRTKAAEIGKLTEQMAAAQALDDIQFQREQLFRTQDEAAVYAQIRNLGLDINSAEGKRVADAIRINHQLEDQLDLAHQMAGVFGEMFSGPIKDAGELFDTLMSGFARIGQANFQAGMNRIFGGLVGGNAGAPGVDAGSVIGKIGDFFGNIATDRRMLSAQNEAVNRAAARVPAQPLQKVMTKVGTTIADTTSNISSSLASYANAIKQVESGGNYSAQGPLVTKGMYAGQRAQGAYQVMPGNIPAWTKELLGYSVSTQEFLRSRAIQDGVFRQQFQKSFEKFGTFSDAASVWFTGQPLNKVRQGANDGYNTVEQYVRKANAALGQTPSAVAAGSEAGVKEGIKAIASIGPNAAAGAGAGAGAGASGSAQMGGGNALMQGVGAALGAFGMGWQSQNPLMGAIGGAVQGYGAGAALGASFGLPGMIIGAVAGGLGGLFGKKSQQRKERGQARNELNKHSADIAALFAAGEGRGLGDYTQRVNDFYDKTAEYDQVAQKASVGMVQKLRDNYNKFFILTEKEFLSSWDGMIEAFETGLGSSSPFVQARDQMQGFVEELKNFVADAQSFGDLQLKHNRDLTPEQLADRVAEAERAAQKMVLASISGARELGAMETEMLRLDGATAVAQQSLEQFGMSAQDAAKAVSAALGVAVAKMRDRYLQDISSSIRALSGVGVINEVLDAQVAYQQRLADAAALGLSGSYAMQELSLSLKDIVASAELTKEEVDLLAQAFPMLATMLSAGLNTTTKSVSEARSQLQAAYDEEASALKDVVSRTTQFVSSLKQFRSQMTIGSSSSLSPEQKLIDAQMRFRDIAAKAAAGDETAMDELTGISQAYLDAARGYYASTAGYVAIWNEVRNTLDQTQVAAEGQLSQAEQQLKALDEQVKGILNVNTSVMSVKDAIDQFNAAQSAHLAAMTQQLAELAQIGRESIMAAYQSNLGRTPTNSELSWWQEQISGGKTVDQVTDAIGNSKEAQINQLYRQIMGRDIDTASRNYWLGTGKSLDQIAADLRYAKSQGAFATGGYTGDVGINQIAGVVHGREFVAHASATARYRPELEAMNRGTYRPANDDSSGALREEIRQLRAELKIALGRLAEVTEESGRAVAGAANSTTQAVQQMGRTAAVEQRRRG